MKWCIWYFTLLLLHIINIKNIINIPAYFILVLELILTSLITGDLHSAAGKSAGECWLRSHSI